MVGEYVSTELYVCSSSSRPFMTPWYGNIILVTGLCEGDQTITAEFPTQGASNAELDVSVVVSLNKLLK